MGNFNFEGRKLMYKNIVTVIMFISSFIMSAFHTANAENASSAGLKITTEVIEVVDSARISLDAKTLTGFIEVSICDRSCVDTRLSITPESVASENGRTVPLKKAKSRLGRDVGIEYDVPTKTVTKISW